MSNINILAAQRACQAVNVDVSFSAGKPTDQVAKYHQRALEAMDYDLL